MKITLPKIFSTLFKKKTEVKEFILTLLLDLDNVAGSCWVLDGKNKPDIYSAVVRRIEKDLWDDRIKATDDIISSLETKIGNDQLKKVVLGLPAYFLNKDGDIEIEVREHLKNLTKQLDLKPIGFVPVFQAISHKLKNDEGIPPSVILLGLSGNKLVLSLYKIGILQGTDILPYDDHVAIRIEQALKNYQEIEVLPSRIMLYGINKIELEKLRIVFTKHPWTSRAGFIHFPKIEILSPETGVISVSIAGAYELSSKLKKDSFPLDVDSDQNRGVDTYIENDQEKLETKKYKSNTNDMSKKNESEKQVSEIEDESDEVKTDESEIKAGQGNDEEEKNVDNNKEAESENVTFVSPESIGFTKNADILEKPKPESSKPDIKKDKDDRVEKIERKNFLTKIYKALSAFKIGLKNTLDKIKASRNNDIGQTPKQNKYILIGLISIIFVTAIGLGIYQLVTNILPSVSITITLIPQKLTEEFVFGIDSNINQIQVDKLLIPVKNVETSVSGEGNIKVSGKKKIGDPAQGEVVIYNKTLSPKSYKKGTKISSGNLTFTIDNDTQIASASESIGSITFGKGKASVTAFQIGEQSNLPSGTEFSVDGASTTLVYARNDETFKGGTSRDVTVVTRSDYDKLVAQISKELIEKAKLQITQNVAGSQKLIEDTIKIKVTDKKFKQDLDTETTDLSGDVSVTVSGLAYDQNDLKILGQEILEKKVPSGYTVEPDSITPEISNITIKKDKTMSASAKLTAKALPNINQQEITSTISGKNQNEASEIIKTFPGIYDITYSYSMNFGRITIPKNSQRISIIIKEP